MTAARIERAANEGVVIGAGAATAELSDVTRGAGMGRVLVVSTGSVVRAGLESILTAAW